MDDQLSKHFVTQFALAVLVLTATAAQAQERLPPAPGTNQRLPLVEFRELPLREALQFLSRYTGLNIVASTNAGSTSVSMVLRDVTPRAALETMAKTHGLLFREDPQSGIITLFTRDEFEVDLRSFREERTHVFTLLYPNAFDAANAIADIYGDRVVLSFGGSQSEVFNDLTERFDRYRLINSQSQNLGLFGGGVGTGGGGFGGGLGGLGGGGFGGGLGGGGFGGGLGGFGGGGFGGFGGQTRTDLLQNQRTARQAVESEAAAIRPEDQIDVSRLSPDQIQALVNAQQGQRNQELVNELLRKQEASIYITVVRRQNQIVVRTSDQETMKQIAELVARLDVPTPLVLLEVKVLSIVLDDDFTSAFDYQFSDGITAAGQFTSGDILPPISDSIPSGTQLRRRTPMTPTTTAPSGTGGQGGVVDLETVQVEPGPFLFQVVSDNFRFRMQLLESKNRVTQLATPILLTANNEVSSIFVGREVPINRGFSGPQPIGNNLGGASTFGSGGTTIEFVPVGTQLLITPNINADRTVTLRLLESTSNIDQNGANILVPTDTGFVNEIVDTVSRRSFAGTVVAKDGLTVAVGGLIEENADDTRQEIPILGKLPVVGFFFRNQQTHRAKNELVILIRPYVFNTPSEAACTSQQVIDVLSLHPNAPEGVGTLGTFAPHEVVRPNPPLNPLQTIFRFHHVEPKDY